MFILSWFKSNLLRERYFNKYPISLTVQMIKQTDIKTDMKSSWVRQYSHRHKLTSANGSTVHKPKSDGGPHIKKTAHKLWKKLGGKYERNGPRHFSYTSSCVYAPIFLAGCSTLNYPSK